ncbi:MAG: type II toxin-antitoxin system VapC family toxin [Planctomycetes bacterium]|nr:type II toxin-antitoxin system VapC family toxin [Planctomycetota bacterium]
MAAVVLDSYALLAYFRGEPEGAAVVELLDKASHRDRPLHMSEVNYAEVKYMILRKDGERAWNDAAQLMSALPIEFHDAGRELADVAAGFKARFKMSLADAFAAALTRQLKGELVTGDPEFKALTGEIKVQFL